MFGYSIRGGMVSCGLRMAVSLVFADRMRLLGEECALKVAAGLLVGGRLAAQMVGPVVVSRAQCRADFELGARTEMHHLTRRLYRWITNAVSARQKPNLAARAT